MIPRYLILKPTIFPAHLRPRPPGAHFQDIDRRKKNQCVKYDDDRGPLPAGAETGGWPRGGFFFLSYAVFALSETLMKTISLIV